MRTLFDIFASLGPEASAALRMRLHLRTVHSGQSIYLQDEPGDEMYRVVNGFVRLSVRHADGRQFVFLIFGPGDFFGASSLVDNELRPQTAEAITSLQLDVLYRPDFDCMRTEHPSFDLAVMRLLSRQMRVASKYLVGTQLNSLRGRVTDRLLELASMAAETKCMNHLSPLRVSQSELADMVGTSRQSINKLLQRLRDQGLIDLVAGKVIIRDLIGLSKSHD